MGENSNGRSRAGRPTCARRRRKLRRAELDAGVLDELLRGADALVHLAAVPDDAPFSSALLPHNISAAEAVVSAAARAAAARRGAAEKRPFALVLASSGKVHVGHAGPLPIGPSTPPAPRCTYGATKLFGEALGQAAAHASGGALRSAAVRFAWCPRKGTDVDRMVEASHSGTPGVGWDEYLSPGDAGACITSLVGSLSAEEDPAAPVPPYSLVFCQSLPPEGGQQRFDLKPTKDLCGWEPRDAFPDGVQAIRDDADYAGAFATLDVPDLG